jgi:hypothetical protein
MTVRRVLATLVMGFAAAGCVHSGFARMAAVEVPARSPGCRLDVVFEGPPPAPYLELGEVISETTVPAAFAIGQNDAVTMRRVMAQACAIGAHGLMNIAASTERVGVGRGRWMNTRGSALAFVYVDASGRPLPPPDGPRDAIGPGTYTVQ